MADTLAELTALRLGGPAEAVIRVEDPASWADAVRRAVVGNNQRPPLVLGHGTNVIASDHGHAGTVLVMATRGLQARHVHGDPRTGYYIDVTVQAGHPLTELVSWATTEGLAGIECMAGIPGTVGAALTQNAGAYGQQIGDTLRSATVWDWAAHRTLTLPSTICALTYRNSAFKRHLTGTTILAVTLRLRQDDRAGPITYRPLAVELGVQLGDRPPLSATTAAMITNRRRRGLLLRPGADDARQVGSVFLNPLVPDRVVERRLTSHGCPVHTDSDGRPRAGAAWLLERAGCRPGQAPDAAIPDIRCSPHRTLTLTAHGAVTARDFATVLEQLRHRVSETSGILLEWEPARVGDWRGHHL